MEKEKMDRLNELNEKMINSGLGASEREEHRLLNMEYLSEMMPLDDDDEN